MNTDTIFTKYADALYRIGKQHGTIQPQAVDLALRLAIADAAGLAQPAPQPVGHVSNGIDPRTIERTFNQIVQLNEWLETNRTDLYFDGKYDTAQAVLVALAQLEAERDTAKDERDVAEAANRRLRDWLAANVAEHSDLDDTELVIHTITAQRAQLATPVGHVGNVTEPPLVHTNGVDPTPAAQSAADWGRSHPAWNGLSDEQRVTVYRLAKGDLRFRQISKEDRIDLVGRVLRHLAAAGEEITGPKFDRLRPEWMPTAGAVVLLAESRKWSELLALTMAATPA